MTLISSGVFLLVCLGKQLSPVLIHKETPRFFCEGHFVLWTLMTCKNKIDNGCQGLGTHQTTALLVS